MTTTRKVARKPRTKGGLTNTALLTWAREFVTLGTQITQMNSRKTELRDRLAETVEKYGQADDYGHIFLDLPEKVANVVGFKRERRVSTRINEDRAEELLKRKKLWDECTTTITVIDEEKLAKAVFNKKLSEDEFDSLRDVNVNYALVPMKK